MIYINRASEKDLTKIRHIGVIRAALIANNRPFKDIYELSKLFGLGTIRMAEIIEQDIVTI